MRRIVWSIFLVWIALGCGTAPIPRIAVTGTTIAVLVPADFEPGFGRVLGGTPDDPPDFDPTSAREDPQRGEMVFELVDAQASHIAYLPIRYVTRVDVDEATPGVIEGTAQFQAGQVIAFLDIPIGTPPTPDPSQPYAILVEKRRRVAGSTTAWETVATTTQVDQTAVPWRGWGQADPTMGIPIVVQSQPGGTQNDWFTPLMGWGEAFATSYTPHVISEEDLEAVTPYPRVRIFVHELDVDLTSPAAWELEITYPAERLVIRDVAPYREGSGHALITWDASGPQAPACGETNGVLKIQMIDPERKAKGVEVAFEPKNFHLGCGARATASDFVPGAFVAYDEDGFEYSTTVLVQEPKS